MLEIDFNSIDKQSEIKVNTQNRILLQFINLIYKPKCEKDDLNVLNGVSGEFHPGRLTAILGPSGAGKTSLLNVLSGFKTSSVEGTILVNGQKRNVKRFRKISSYIPQNFAMLPELTVDETLNFSAELKLYSDFSGCQKKKVVDDIIILLNLTKCRKTLVKNLSGGEQKRLSIGIELVTNPPIMFFDEPTSGLDSVASVQVLQHLHDLAHSGRTIVCVIHQPSSRLLKYFDDIYLLSDGQCLYNGPLEAMLSEFEKVGLTCPTYYNRADYALEVASKEINCDISQLIDANQKKFSSFDLKEISITSENEEGILKKELNK